MADIWDDIGNAQPTGRGRYFEDGDYEVTILNIKRKRTPKSPTNGKFIISALVDKASGEGSNPAGSTRDQTIDMDNTRSNGSWKGDVHAFALALFGKKEGEVSKEEVSKTLRQLEEREAQQLMRGQRMKLRVWKKPQVADKTKMFTVHAWEHVKMTADERKARRAEVDGAAAQVEQTAAGTVPY